jgi:2-dehydropantoate 2-reductase
MKNKINSIYILGLGALGGLYAAKFYDMDANSVKIIADKKRIAIFQKTPPVINGKTYSFAYIEPGDQSQKPPDLLIIAVKSLQLKEAIQAIRSFIGKDTAVISLLNGISSEELIGEQIGTEHLLYAYGIGMDAVRTGNNVNFKSPGRLVFGEKDNTILSDRVRALKDLFEQAQVPYRIPADMYRALWGKFMMNTGINQASAVLKAPYGVFQQNAEARKLMLAASNEVTAIAQKLGIGLDQTHLDEFLNTLAGLNPAGKTSMLQDIEAGRKSEIAIFAGTVIGLGKKYGVPTPVNEVLYSIIKAMETM